LRVPLPELSAEIVEFAPYMKHNAFASEKEWRLISPRLDDSTMKFQYREGPRFLKPYLEFPLAGITVDDVRDLTIGPGPNAELAQNAAYTLARQNEVNVGGGIAAAPYRPW
jgi:hypothetical protein